MCNSDGATCSLNRSLWSCDVIDSLLSSAVKSLEDNDEEVDDNNDTYNIKIIIKVKLRIALFCFCHMNDTEKSNTSHIKPNYKSITYTYNNRTYS